MIAWATSVIGLPGVDWMFEEDDDSYSAIFSFRHERDARHFHNVWNRDPAIMPYHVWEEFCSNPLGKKYRLDALWVSLRWKPSTVFMSHYYGDPPKENIVIGGNSHYHTRLRVYFFEFEADAVMHWIEHGQSYNRH